MPRAHILFAWQGEHGDAYFDSAHPQLARQLKLKEGAARMVDYAGRNNGENSICFLFAFGVRWSSPVFNRCAMGDQQSTVVSCTEHERLAFKAVKAAGGYRHGSIMNGSIAARVENFGEKGKGWRSSERHMRRSAVPALQRPA